MVLDFDGTDGPSLHGKQEGRFFHSYYDCYCYLLLSSLAYVLVERLRTLALAGTEFARLQATMLRAKLLKIGVVIIRNTRRVRVMLSSVYPYQEIFRRAALALCSP